MPASEETGSGPVVHDHRRIDPVTWQVRGRHAASKPAGTPGAGRPAGAGSGGTGTGTGTSISSNGGSLTSGGGASTTSSTSSSNLPFTGFELATVLTLGVGAIGAGSVVVVSSRRRRDTSAIA